ncbi:P22 phage major capsid protein family protein [Nocardiopsis sp. NPDC006198]|uniref:P22 phage major capsid protein family protein n=1 Tax=Nocardiopsis sp. NPDC006198 TaxID=3154472 RepID=UPI0033BF33CF
MANTFLTPDIIARAALATLYETCVMAQLVHRDYSSEFVPKVGGQVTIRKPAIFEAQEFVQADGITIQDANEGEVPVVLNHFADVSFAVTSRDRTLAIEDFSAQLLDPALEAISQKIDRDILAFRDDITQEVGVVAGDVMHPWSDPRSLIDAGRVLDEAKVPERERRAVVGPLMAANWIADPLFSEADKRGSTEGLIEAGIGRKFGFDTYKTQNIKRPTQGPGVSTTEVGVGFHRTAVALVTRPLELPGGAANAAIASYKGFGIRVVMDYDITSKRDIVSLDTLYGVKTLDATRAVLIKGADGS